MIEKVRKFLVFKLLEILLSFFVMFVFSGDEFEDCAEKFFRLCRVEVLHYACFVVYSFYEFVFRLKQFAAFGFFRINFDTLFISLVLFDVVVCLFHFLAACKPACSCVFVDFLREFRSAFNDRFVKSFCSFDVVKNE